MDWKSSVGDRADEVMPFQIFDQEARLRFFEITGSINAPRRLLRVLAPDITS
jgi:hypothetical protein